MTQKTDNNEPLTIDVATEAVEAEIGVTVELWKKERKAASDKLEKGRRLKRTPFEAIEEKGYLDPKTMYDEYQKIQNRESRLSASEREVICSIVETAMRTVFARKIDEARKAGEVKPGIQKKKRTKKVTPKAKK